MSEVDQPQEAAGAVGEVEGDVGVVREGEAVGVSPAEEVRGEPSAENPFEEIPLAKLP